MGRFVWREVLKRVARAAWRVIAKDPWFFLVAALMAWFIGFCWIYGANGDDSMEFCHGPNMYMVNQNNPPEVTP